MRACQRPACPDWLAKHWVAWGDEYAERLAADPHYRFNWKSHDGERVNQRLLPVLRTMTQEHCAYCDWFPTDVGTDPTIDHFRPKAQFPKEAYHWQNLYLCCRTCQDKDDAAFSDDLLRPDEIGYAFDRFFIYKYENGILEANPQAPVADQRRAQLTIDNFKLNHGGRPAARKRALDQFKAFSPEDQQQFIDTMPFRYLLCHEMAT